MRILHRLLPFLLVMLTLVACASLGGTTIGASSTVVVTATVPSAITMTNTCRQRAAWDLGTVLPGANALTDTAANVCHIAFQSSNDTSMLRVVQSDRTGTAMTRGGTTYTTSGSGAADGPTVDVAASSGTEAFATMGYGGTQDYWKSSDGGTTWPVQTDAAGPTAGFPFVVNPVAGLVLRATSDTRIRISTNGGTNWANVPAGGWGGIGSIDATDANHIWVNDGSSHVYVTTNGGGSWANAATPCFNGLKMSAESATVAYEPGIMWATGLCVTTNGGSSWQQRQAAAGVPANENYTDIDAPAGTPATAWAVGSDGTILKTTNTGTSWTAQNSHTYLWLHGVFARTTTDVWAVGDEGVVLHTTDGGTNWNRVSVPTSLRLVNVSVPTATQVLIGGYGQTLLVTTDGGTNWTAAQTNGEQGWTGIDAVSRDTAIVAGGKGAIERTGNAGGNWTAATVPGTTNMRDVTYAGSGEAIAVGDAGTVWLSMDGGASFAARPSPVGSNLHSIDASNDDLAVAVGDAGAIETSSDGGRSWTSRASGTGNDLTAVAVLDAQRAVAVGAGGVVIRTTDSGVTWTAATPVAGFNLRWVTMPSSSTIYASATATVAGGSGFVWKSTDGGATFTRLVAAVSGAVSAANDDILFVADETSGALGYYEPTMQVSRDGGQTFTPYTTSNPDSHDVVAVDGSVAFAAADNGFIRRTDPATSIADYGGANTWASTNTFFGGCLQALGGSAVAGSWLPKGSTCTDVDTGGYWNAVPNAPVKVAKVTTAGLAGSADFVWGLHTSTGLSPGKLAAGVTFEALAPDV